jgi:hypothetical protein
MNKGKSLSFNKKYYIKYCFYLKIIVELDNRFLYITDVT